jgi:hypothetical protein
MAWVKKTADNEHGATWICLTGISLGLMGFVGSVFWAAAGAGIYGSPLQGRRSWITAVILFLLTGPMALLPLAILGIWRRRWAGRLLVLASLVSAILAVRIMWSPLAEWSGDPSGIPASAFRWSLALIFPISVPILAIGLGFLRNPNGK